MSSASLASIARWPAAFAAAAGRRTIEPRAPLPHVISPRRDGAPDVAFDVVTVVDHFFHVEKRSETLDGSIPLRAPKAASRSWTGTPPASI